MKITIYEHGNIHISIGLAVETLHKTLQNHAVAIKSKFGLSDVEYLQVEHEILRIETNNFS